VNTHSTQSGDVLFLRHGRLRALLIAIVCAIGVAGLWSIRDEAGWATVGVAILLVGGFGTVAGVLRLLPGAGYLRLDSKGFTYRAAFWTVSVAWDDVAEFGVVAKDATHAYATVGFNFVLGYGKNAAGRELARSINGWEGALPGTYGRRAEELAELMNEWLGRWKDGPLE
jgi:hypothetical protein